MESNASIFLRKEAPGIPIVVITGYPDQKMARELLAKGIKNYLIKPVPKEKLLQAVHDLVVAGKDFDY